MKEIYRKCYYVLPETDGNTIIDTETNAYNEEVITLAVGVMTSKKEKRPSFTDEQIINVTDVQRNWKTEVVPKLGVLPYLVVLRRQKPKVAIMDYKAFVDLWQRAQEFSELQLKMEVLLRYVEQENSGRKLTTLRELLSKANISLEDLEAMLDVEIEPDRSSRER